MVPLDHNIESIGSSIFAGVTTVGCLCSDPTHRQISLNDSYSKGWLGSRVDSVLDSGAAGPRFKSQSRRCRVTVLGKLFTLIVPLFTKQENW